MLHQVNRGAEILKNWDSYKLQLETSMGDGMPGLDIKKEKYDFLVAGLARLSIQPSIDERIYSSMISSIVKRLREEVFPNRLLRILVRIRELTLQAPRIKRGLIKKKQENFAALDKIVKDMGITNMSGYLAAQLDHERSSVELSLLSRFHGENSLELSLNLQKDRDGYYQVDNVSASLFTAGEKSRRCLIDNTYGIQVDQIYHLLRGSSVMISRPGDEHGEKWVQLDFNQTDLNGHHHLREHHLQQGCELDKLLKVASENIGYPLIDRPEILKALSRGAPATFKIEGSGDFSLEACPGKSALLFRDAQKQLVPAAALKEKIAANNLLRNTLQPVIKKLKTKKSLDRGISRGL